MFALSLERKGAPCSRGACLLVLVPKNVCVPTYLRFTPCLRRCKQKFVTNIRSTQREHMPENVQLRQLSRGLCPLPLGKRTVKKNFAARPHPVTAQSVGPRAGDWDPSAY